MTSTRLASRLTSSRRRGDPGRRWARLTMAVLATIGLLDTGSITLHRWGVLGPLICPGGSDGCDKVLSSAWGTFLGQPLSLFGALAYLAVLLLALLPLLLKGESRAELHQKSWWALFVLSTCMAIFSLVLLGVMVFKIQAFCAFCLLSATVSLALMVLAIVGGEWAEPGQLIFRGILIGLAVLVFGIGWATALDRPESAISKGMSPPITAPSSPAAIALAKFLTAKGAVIYTAYWCPHCHEQKELFGKEAAAELKIVECAPDGHKNQAALCKAKKIDGFPSWEINGTVESGVKPLAKLAAMAGYKGPNGF
ncbi:MAG: vitamin K epoxide reductase family protein [Cyanobacteriota bacterium]|nr:vitamin K epoxide reductase family protein [Cyanobacteriota bacterium]